VFFARTAISTLRQNPLPFSLGSSGSITGTASLRTDGEQIGKVAEIAQAELQAALAARQTTACVTHHRENQLQFWRWCQAQGSI
jgi:hypothetical protein